MTTFELETKEGLFALMEQIAAEREAARPTVEKLVASGEPVEDIEIQQEWRTAGMVLELCESAYAGLESEPRRSLAFSQLAFVLAVRITLKYPQPLSAYLEGRSCTEIGYAHRYLDAYEPSVFAYKRAEEEFSHESALVHQETSARFARACVLFRADKHEEASELNATTMSAFRESGDRGRQMRCTVLDAAIEVSTGEFESARAKYESMLGSVWECDDLHTLGTVYNNLGHAYLRLRRTSDAVMALERAREIFRSLDMPAEVNRADWGLASVLFAAGQPAKALPLLNRLRNDFLSRQMPSAAGEIGLFIVDALIATDQVDAAKALTTQVLKEFVDAHLNTLAISALAYLRDLLDTTTDSRAALERVRSYLKELRSTPSPLFLRLDDDP